ncbi:MAG: TVP38/TMEM64 family protein [Vicinamibacterales bacterium]
MRHRDRWLAGLALVAIASLVGWSYLSGGFASVVLSPSLDGDAKVRYIQDYFFSWGSLAPLIYILIVILEVVIAPIPGTMLYVPGGLIFGWEVGGLTTLAGNVIGAALCAGIARSLGRPYAERFFSSESLNRYDALLSRNAIRVIFLLRVNPVTSSDLVSYAAGLTSMPVWKIAAGTLAGMAPLCFLQAYFAEELFTRFPVLLYPLAVVSICYVAYVVWILSRMKNTPAAASSDDATSGTGPSRSPIV